MNIAYILDTYPTLSETFIAREIEALRECGFTIEIFALHAGQGAHQLENQVTVQRFFRVAKSATTGKQQVFEQLGARWWNRAAAQYKLDWIHGAFASHPADIAFGAARVANLPWSFSGHARDIFVDGSQLARKIEAARFVGVCTRAGQAHLQAASSQSYRQKILYIPHGLHLEEFPLRENHAATSRQILSVGRLVEKKGFLVLLQALTILQKSEHSINAKIIGEGAQRRTLEQAISRLDLQAAVELCGAQSQSEVRRQMCECACLVVPSIMARDGDRDGLPNVVLEAAACGVPLVATNAGAIADFVDEATGRVCTSRDAAELAARIREVFSQPAETQRLCGGARRRVEEQFDIRRNIQLLARAFRGEASS